MKVAFNARLLHDANLRGWNRYTVNLLAELPPLGVALYLYTDRALDESHLARLPAGSYRVSIAPPMKYIWWEQHWLSQQCRADRVDLLHSPFHFGLPWRSPVPRVLTLHDAIGNSVYQWIARRCAERVITVSEKAKRDLMKSYGIPSNMITVTHEAAETRFFAPIGETEQQRVTDAHGLSHPFVLYVGGWEPRKNVPFLLQAFAAARLEGIDLVLAGGDSEHRGSLRNLAVSLGISERTHMLGWVADADLPALYSGAMCFVYPSLHEGFGLQLCEAMAVGIPVLASDRGSVPEVLDGGGETFSLDRPDELSAYLRRIAADSDYREELSIRSKRRGAMFSWKCMAEQTLSVYQKLLER